MMKLCKRVCLLVILYMVLLVMFDGFWVLEWDFGLLWMGVVGLDIIICSILW